MRFLDLIMSFILYQWQDTALHYAAFKGHVDVARLLLEKGAYVNAIDNVSDMILEIIIIVSVGD